MKNLVIGFAVGVCFPFLLGLLFLMGGLVPMNTQAPPLPMEKWVARRALHIAFANELKTQAPFDATEDHLRSGAKIYLNNCAGCHGLPDHEPPRFAKGMFPHPPALFKHGVADDAIGETYWKTKNGIRLSGMPGYVNTLTDTEIWEVSTFLKNGDHLSDGVKSELRSD